MGGGSRGSRRNDGWRASSETGARSVAVSGGETKTFGALVETAVLLLVAFSSTDETGVIILRMGWGEDWVGLVKKSLSSICSFLGFLGA